MAKDGKPKANTLNLGSKFKPVVCDDDGRPALDAEAMYSHARQTGHRSFTLLD